MASHNNNNSRKTSSNNNNMSHSNLQKKLNSNIRQAPKHAKAKVGKWERMVVNPLDNEPVRTPSSSPFTGAVRTFVRTIAISSGGPASHFSMAVRPDLTSTFSLERAVPVPFPLKWALANPSAIVSDFLYTNRFILVGELDLSDTAVAGSPTIAEVETIIDNNDHMPYYPLIGDATTKFDLHFSGTSNFLGYALLQGGVWGAAVGGHGYNPATSYVVGPVAGGFEGIRVISGPTDSVAFAMVANAGTTMSAPFNACYDLFTTDAVTLGRVSSYRVTAMSVLASYSGNLFNNGGVISAARVRRNYCYDQDTPYDSLTKLQDHAYRGVIKDGAYVWWLPYALPELDFRSPNDVVSDTELRLAGIFEDNSGQLQVTLTMAVEFYSPLQIFEHKVGPPLMDNFITAYHNLDSIPAATCNPKHTELLKGVLGKAKKAAGGVAGFFAAHPELAYALLAMV
jgi:hypothetical protein